MGLKILVSAKSLPRTRNPSRENFEPEEGFFDSGRDFNFLLATIGCESVRASVYLRGDAGMVGARQPEGRLAAHAMEARQDVLRGTNVRESE